MTAKKNTKVNANLIEAIVRCTDVEFDALAMFCDDHCLDIEVGGKVLKHQVKSSVPEEDYATKMKRLRKLCYAMPIEQRIESATYREYLTLLKEGAPADEPKTVPVKATKTTTKKASKPKIVEEGVADDAMPKTEKAYSLTGLVIRPCSSNPKVNKAVKFLAKKYNAKWSGDFASKDFQWTFPTKKDAQNFEKEWLAGK